MNLYLVIKKYGDESILELVWAKHSEDVCTLLDWTSTDKPPLRIIEMVPREGCVLSTLVKTRHLSDL